MMNAVARTSALSPYLSAVSQVVPSALRPAVPAVVDKSQKIFVAPRPEPKSNYSLAALHPQRNRITVTNGLSSPAQVRFAHTDVQMPDFSAYRRKDVSDPSRSSQESDASRKAFTYLMVAGGTVAGAYGSKAIVQQFVSTMSASADVLALAKIEVKLSDIPEGKSATFKWRNKPLFIRHRTAEEIAREEAVDLSTLRDQQHDSERVQKPQWLILLGVCTHLGCVPIAGTGDYGGYYCPCHGSHYDASGRIRKGPAPLNLEVPIYNFVDEDNVIVG